MTRCRYFKVHNRRHAGDTIEPHLIKLNVTAGFLWTGEVQLDLPSEYFRNDDNDTERLKLEMFLTDSKGCHSPSIVEFLELLEPEIETAGNSYWVQVSPIVFYRVI